MTKLKLPSEQLDNINIKIRIESLKSLIELIQAGIEKKKGEALQKIETLKGKTKDESDIHEVHTEEEIFALEYVNYFEGSFECSQLENTATYSIIPSCYMLFETNLVAFAKIAKEHYCIDLKYNELVGGKTEKIKIYLKKMAGIDVSSIPSWSSLNDLEIIRECIIHTEGKVNTDFKDYEKIKDIIKKYQAHISVNKPLHENENYIIAKFSLCELFLEKLNSFFDELIALFGFDQNFYFGAEASKQILDERIQAKIEYDRSVEKAKEIYNNRMKSL
jgi:hypothetical protein